MHGKSRNTIMNISHLRNFGTAPQTKLTPIQINLIAARNSTKINGPEMADIGLKVAPSGRELPDETTNITSGTQKKSRLNTIDP